MEAPVLESERLRLRGHRLEDFDPLAAMWADPAVVRHISGTPQSRTESWARLLRYVGHWRLRPYGFWALEERATGAYLGEVGFGDFHRELEPKLEDIPEAGWVLASHAHGKGYALEAMHTALAWLDARHPRTQCIISPSNRPSQKLAAKLGFTASHDARHRGEIVTVWVRGVSRNHPVLSLER